MTESNTDLFIRGLERWQKSMGLGAQFYAFALVASAILAITGFARRMGASPRELAGQGALPPNWYWAPAVFVTLPMLIAVRHLTRPSAGIELDRRSDICRVIGRWWLTTGLMLGAALSLAAMMMHGTESSRGMVVNVEAAWAMVGLVNTAMLAVLAAYLSSLAGHPSIESGKRAAGIAMLGLFAMAGMMAVGTILALIPGQPRNNPFELYAQTLNLAAGGIGCVAMVSLWVAMLEIAGGIADLRYQFKKLAMQQHASTSPSANDMTASKDVTP